jgi:xanthine dehydrogenase YagT iron-sulfur-binding subunit
MDHQEELKDLDINETDPQLSADEEKLLDELGLKGAARRQFLGQGITAGLGLFALQLLAKEKSYGGHGRIDRRCLLSDHRVGKRSSGCTKN